MVASGATPSRSSATSARIPARLAADDGSQNTPSMPGEIAVGGQDLGVGHGLDPATGLVSGRGRQRPAGRIADPDRGRDRLGLGDRVADHERCRAGRLEAVHPGRARRQAGRPVVAEPGPIGADVAGIADRDRQDVGRPPEIVADLEGGGLLARQPVRVDRVHERDRVIVPDGQIADDPERGIEVPVDRHHTGPGDQRLEQLAGRDPALRQDDDRLQPGGRAVGGRRRGGVARRGAHDRAGPGLERRDSPRRPSRGP